MMRGKFKFLGVCLGLIFLASLVLSGPMVTGAQAKPLKIGFSMALSGGLAAAGGGRARPGRVSAGRLYEPDAGPTPL